MKNMLLEPGNLVHAQGHIVGALSGVITALSAGDDVFEFRWISAARDLPISAVRFAAYTVTPHSAALGMAFQLHKVGTFSAIGSGGKTIVVPTLRKTTGMTALAAADYACVVSNTGALTPGTYAAPDADEPMEVFTGPGSTTPSAEGKWEPRDGLPTVLAANEGLIVRATRAIASTQTIQLFVGLEVPKM